MSKTKAYKLGLLLLLAVMLISACGGNSNQNGGKTNTGGSGGSSPAPKSVTLKLTTWNPISQAAIDKFQDQYPHITIEHEQIADQYREIIRTRIISKADMDLIWMFPNQLREYAGQDVLMDMTGEPWLDNYLESAVQIGTVDGKTFGPSYNYYAVVFFYNKDIFKSLNLTPPSTWDELLEVSAKIKESGVAPIITGGKDAWATQFVTSSHYGYYQTENPALFDQLASGEKKWTDPELSGFFDPLIELVDKGYFLENSIGLGNDQVKQVFKEGKAAMYPMGTWSLEDFTEDFKEFEVGAFAVPLNRTGEPLVVNLVSDNIFTGVSWSKHQEEIKLFMSFLSEPENALLWSQDTKSAVTVKGGTSPDYHPIAAELSQVIDNNITSIFPSLTPSMEPTYFPILQQILLGEHPSAAELLAEMQRVQEKDYP